MPWSAEVNATLTRRLHAMAIQARETWASLRGRLLADRTKWLGRQRAPVLLLDFARPQRRSMASGIMAVALGMILLSLASWQSDLAQSRVAELEAELAGLGFDRGAEHRRASQTRLRGAELDERVVKANRVIRQLSIPWEDIFGSIEAANNPDVALLSLDSDPTSAQVRAAVEARNTRGMLDYLDRLRLDGRVAPAILQSHQIMTEDPNRPVRFTFTASWTSAKHAQK
jgi:hypothetical protein